MTDTRTTLQPLIRETFCNLADALELQPSTAWDTPSLCEAWRVREVVAHMSTAARYQPEEFFAELEANGGDIGRTIDSIAARDGALDPDVLLANLRDGRLHQWVPPGGGQTGALQHAVIHSLDVSVPLGLRQQTSPAALRIVLDDLTAGGLQTHFGVSLDGVDFHATDIQWSWGVGRVVSAPAAELVLALSGRR